jgi:ABC-2 type transport system ATP-binding protein
VRWAIDFTVGFFGGRAYLRREVVQRFGLEPLLDATIGSLSKGQRKRALIAIGLLMPQPVLLADEPFDGLDLRQSREVAQTLRSYASAGRTMFLSIHQIRDAARVCDRFVLLSSGRARGEGTLQELAAVAAARGSRAGDDLEEVFLALT